MTNISERSDWGALLKKQSRRTIVAISVKASAKCFPTIFSHITDPDIAVQKTVLYACWALLGGVCASYFSANDSTGAIGKAVEALMASRHSLTDEGRLAAESIAQAARSSVSGAPTGIDAINTSILVALANKERNYVPNSSDTEHMIHGAISRDIKQLERHKSEGHELFIRAPLKEDPIFGDIFSQTWELLANSDAASSPVWAFWFEFFEGLVQGREFDQELASLILNIEESLWQLGPESIASEIERLKIEILSKKLPVAEQIEFNKEAGKFNVSPIEVMRKQFMEAILGQADDALQDVLGKPSNGLTSQSRETVVLRRTFERYRKNPQRVEMDFTSVHQSLARQISVQELPASEENVALEKALREGAQAIRANHPEIKQNRETLNEQAILELSAEDQSIVIEALPILEEISEGDLLADWNEDVDYLLEARFRSLHTTPALGPAIRNPVLAGYDQKVRLFGRAARIMLILRSTPEVVQRIDQCSTYKAARIITTIAALVTLGIALIA